MDRRQFLAAASGTAAALALGAHHHARAAGETCRFVPVQPTRVLDSRNDDTSPPLPGGTLIPLRVVGDPRVTVPATAKAVVLNVTCTQSQEPGYVSCFPSGTGAINTSVLNVMGGGQTVAALVTVMLNPTGWIDLYTRGGSHLIADIFGYYEGAPSADRGRLVPMGPFRVHDTRLGAGAYGADETRGYGLPVGVPADATALVLNITVARAAGPGFWSAWKDGPRPLVSNVNTNAAEQVVANQAIVPVGASGFSVYSSAGGDLVLDVAGYFTGTSGGVSTTGLFVPVVPTRLLDTRGDAALNPLVDEFQPRSKKPHSGWTVEVPVIGRGSVPSNAGAVALSVTLTSSEAPGYVTTWPARTVRPLASTANTGFAGNTVANHAIVPISDAGVSLYSIGGAHLLADLMGWFTGSPVGVTTGRAANPPTPGLAFPVTLNVPRLGAVGANSVMTCFGDTSNATLVYGPGHLVGTSFPGAPSNTAIFGHRTTHTAPFFFLDQMEFGDLIELSNGAGVARYSVEAVRSAVSPADETMYYLGSDRPTLTLIACTPPHSTRYRIVVQAVLFDFVEY